MYDVMPRLGPTARRALALALAVSFASFSIAGWASGQEPGRGTARSGRGARAEREERGAPAARNTGAEPDAPATSEGEVRAESEVIERGGEKVKAIRFGGLDVVGRLKSPQILYFFNRLRAEFERPRLPHRSFLSEMERSTHGTSF
jgi:hypothetical protein